MRRIELKAHVGGCKNHLAYNLRCEDYAHLLDRSGNCCEICGLPAHRNDWQKLFIDHDARVGKWAVRGLLCSDCNMNMRRMPEGDWRLQRFIDRPWYLAALDCRGVDLAAFPEPPRRSLVCNVVGKHWLRTTGGWLHVDRYRDVVSIPITWKRLLYDVGPLALYQH